MDAQSWKLKAKNLLSYFDVASDLEPQADVEESIRSGVSFRGSTLLVLIFAIFIASLGLNTDSVAVIIGAMLISPLMGPIMGMGLALGVEDVALLKRGAKNIGIAVLGSVLASAIYFLISPQYENSSQLLARTSPSIYDVFIALFGGAAGIVSTACRNKGQVLPGVAIATSLMPPLCTAGYGLATMQMKFFLGAFYLFFTNMIFILFATWIGVKLMGYKRKVQQETQGYKRVQILVYTIICATIAVSVYLTVIMIGKNVFMARAAAFVENDMVFPNTQVLSHKEYIEGGKKYIDVTLIGQQLPHDSLLVALNSRLDSVGLGGSILRIKQGFSLPTGQNLSEKTDSGIYHVMQAQMAYMYTTTDSLRRKLAESGRIADAGVALAPEIRVVFPTINDLAMARTVVASVRDTLLRDTLNIAFVRTANGLTEAERERLRRYLQVRLNQKDVRLSVNPRDFPWPEQ